MDVIEVKRALANQVEALARHLFPQGKRSGHEWEVGSLEGEAGQSFKINLGAKAGVWSDFASGVGGDNLLELWRVAKNVDFRTALQQAGEWAGVKDAGAGIKRRVERVYQKPSYADVAPKEEIEQSPTRNYLLNERMLSLETLQAYRIAASKNGEIVFPYFAPNGTDLEMIKYLSMDRDERGKKKIRTSANSKKALWGKHLITGDDRSIIITEGEIDAMSWHELGLRAVSVPFGAKSESAKTGVDPNEEWIENDWELLESFEKIYLSFDADEEGKKARNSILKRLGRERCYLIDLPVKDANQAWMEGLHDEMREAFNAAKTEDPEQLKNAKEYIDEVAAMTISNDGAPISLGIPMPFATKTGEFHWRMHEVTVQSGTNGSGKTQLLNWCQMEFIALGRKCLDFSFEVQPAQTLRYQVAQVLAKDYPKDMDELKAAVNWIGEGMWYYDHVGRVNKDDVLSAMAYAHRRYGIQFFIIDSWMKLGIDPDDFKGQKDFMDRLADFVRDYEVHIIIVVHSRKMMKDADRAGKMDVKGAGEIMDLAHNGFVTHRNFKKEADMRELREKLKGDESTEDRQIKIKIDNLDHAEPDAEWQCTKQRNGYGELPMYKLWYHLKSRQYATERKGPVAKLDVNALVSPSEHITPPIPFDEDTEMPF